MYEDKNLNIKSILNQAWYKTKENKSAYFLASFLIVAVYLFINFIIFPLITPYVIINKTIDTPSALLLFMFSMGLPKIAIYSFVLFPAVAGLLMMGVNDNKKLPQLFISYKDFLKLGLGYFIVSFPIYAGLALFLVHIRIYTFLIVVFLMIYLPTWYSLFIPLVMKEKLGVWSALKTSKLIISRNINKAIGLYVVMLVILIASALPLGIGLIWSIPLCIEAYGIFYHQLLENNSKALQKSGFAEMDLF